MEKNKEITIENVGILCDELLNTDICHLRVKEDKKFFLEIKYLRDLLDQYRASSGRLRGEIMIYSVEKVAQALIQQVQHCLRCLDQEENAGIGNEGR